MIEGEMGPRLLASHGFQLIFDGSKSAPYPRAATFTGKSNSNVHGPSCSDQRLRMLVRDSLITNDYAENAALPDARGHIADGMCSAVTRIDPLGGVFQRLGQHTAPSRQGANDDELLGVASRCHSRQSCRKRQELRSARVRRRPRLRLALRTAELDPARWSAAFGGAGSFRWGLLDGSQFGQGLHGGE